jgi:phosphatidylserine/phosphatidylglycerophosphate/cardiolipin synthase-like enzyme
MQSGWNGWKEFPGPGQPVKSLCVGRNDGRVTLWALSQDDSLHNLTQTTVDHHWPDFIESKWDAGGTRPPSKPSLLTEIATVLGRGTDSKYRGMTYEVTSHNTFTLLDTPGLWDKSSTAPNPIPACEILLNRITETIGQARKIVDIATMSEFVGKDGELPSGGFQKALSRGFRSLVKSKSSPLVRITIGITTPSIITGVTLKNWVKTTIELDGGKLGDVTFPILIGGGKETITSWNHSKIVAADGVRAVVGGHNLWGKQYLGATPGSRRLGIV